MDNTRALRAFSDKSLGSYPNRYKNRVIIEGVVFLARLFCAHAQLVNQLGWVEYEE